LLDELVITWSFKAIMDLASIAIDPGAVCPSLLIKILTQNKKAPALLAGAFKSFIEKA
jgi:hypothetical protein